MPQKHFVLIHGSSHGAWCWYKLKPLLESAGHKATALDLSASGVNPKQLRDLRTLHDYTLPLMEFMSALPAGEKVILVGHSFGGMNISLAMENYPHNISVAVFLTAFMPDSVHAPSYVLDQDIALGGMLIRPSSFFSEDLSKIKKFTDEGYGSVKRNYIICTEDLAIPLNFQRWLIESIGVAKVKEIKDADHMAMLSKPQQLCQTLLEIAGDE